MCAIVNSKEYCLTNVEYGWSEDEIDYTGNMLILKNLRDENENIKYFDCSFDEYSSNCYIKSVHLRAHSGGLVDVFDTNDIGCSIDDGSSYCGI